jgi:predicted O-methyltransferase YrrM
MRNAVLSPDAASILVREILIRKPKMLVELGSGVSTSISARSIELSGVDGHVYSIDHEAQYFEQTRQLLRASGLEDRVTLIHAPLIERDVNHLKCRWYDVDLTLLPSAIDLLVVDGPPAVTEPLARYPALPLLLSRLSPEGAVFIDDYGRPGETEVVRRWMSECSGLNLTVVSTEKGTAILTREPGFANGSTSGCPRLGDAIAATGKIAN